MGGDPASSSGMESSGGGDAQGQVLMLTSGARPRVSIGESEVREQEASVDSPLCVGAGHPGCLVYAGVSEV